MKTKSDSRKGETGTTGRKLCFSYRRYSSKNQEQNTSLERQYSDAFKIASEKGWELVDLPPDEGISAFKVEGSNGELAANMHRGNLGAFLKRVEKKEIPKGSVLIVERLDRFSRNYWDIVFPVWVNLMQSGIEVYSCVSNSHYTLEAIRRNPMLGAMALMEFASANDYSSGMSKRIGNAFSIRLTQCAKGQKMNLGGWVPKWFDFVGEEKQPGEYKPNKHFDTIQRICREYIEGRSMYQIARSLIADKIPTVMGGKWAQGTIANLLRHGTLTGTLNLKGTTIPDFYPPVLTEKEWNKLQGMLRQNRERKGGDGASDYIANLFRNRCKCFHCQETVTTAKSSTERLYTCKGKRVGKCPSKYSIKVSELELDFFLGYMQQTPGEILRSNTTEQSDKIASLQSKLAKQDKDIKGITDLIGTIPIDELKGKLVQLETQRQATKSELDKVTGSLLGSQNAPKALAGVKDILKQLDCPTGKPDPTDPDYKAILQRIRAHLDNNDTRKKMLSLLPSFIKSVIIDTTGRRYAVLTHTGTQSPWRTV